jgi:hypothetical protein
MLRVIAFVFVACGLLVACSASGYAADVPPVSSSTTVVVTGTEPDRYILYNSSLNAFDDAEGRARMQFDTAMKGQNLRLGHDIQAAIATRLSQMGYTVQLREIAHRDWDELLKPEDVANAGVDLVFDVVLEVAQYANTPFSRALRPSVWLRVRAIDVRARKYVFRERFTYDGHHDPIVTVNVEPDPKYDFHSEAELFADPARAAEGLRAAAPLIAEQVAVLLAKRD